MIYCHTQGAAGCPPPPRGPRGSVHRGARGSTAFPGAGEVPAGHGPASPAGDRGPGRPSGGARTRSPGAGCPGAWFALRGERPARSQRGSAGDRAGSRFAPCCGSPLRAGVSAGCSQRGKVCSEQGSPRLGEASSGSERYRLAVLNRIPSPFPARGQPALGSVPTADKYEQGNRTRGCSGRGRHFHTNYRKTDH